MAESVIVTSLKVGSQLPLDSKIYARLLSDIQTLGTNNAKAFEYYEDMVVHVVQNHNNYIWRELASPTETGGLITGNYTYPANHTVNGIAYGGRTFNFFLVETGGSQNLQQTLDNGFMATNRSIILSGSPASFNASGAAGVGSLSANRLRMQGTTDRVMDIANETIINRANTDPTSGRTTLQFALPNLGDSNTDNTITIPADTGIMALTKNIPVYVAGTNISIDNSNPAAPVINASGGGSTPNLSAVLTAGSTANSPLTLNGGNATLSVANGSDNALIFPGTFDARSAAARTTYMPDGVRFRNIANSNYIQIQVLAAPTGQYIQRLPQKTGTFAMLDDIPAPSTGTLEHVRTPISTAQITAGSNINLTPTPTGGRVILIHRIVLVYSHGGTAFNQGTMQLIQGTGNNITGQFNLNSYTADRSQIIELSAGSITIGNDAPITVTFSTPPTTGNGNFVFLIDYGVRVINPN